MKYLLQLFVLSFMFSTDCSAQLGDIKSIPDPAIIRGDDGWFYVYSTGRGIKVHKSRDLVFWQSAGTVMPYPVPAWAVQKVPGANAVWAPDISYHNGRYWLYYSVSTFGSQRSLIGLMSNLSLNPSDSKYNWIDHGPVVESFPGKNSYNAIDPAAFTDQQDRRWLVWGSYWGGIKMTQLDPETGKCIDEKNLITVACRPQVKAIEAPYIIYRMGYYYLFVSFDFCCDGVNSTYKVMVGRSRDVKGPYLDYNGNDMKQGAGTLVIAGYDQWRGPGHNSVINKDGSDYMVLHTYDAREKGRRNLQIREMIWSGDGWPLVLEPVSDHVDVKPGISIRDITGTWIYSVNYLQPREIYLFEDGSIDQRGSIARWQSDRKIIRFLWPDASMPGGMRIDRCYISPDAKSCIGRNRSGMVVRTMRKR